MEWTGERWVPGASPGGIEEQHVARYEWAKGFCEDKRVLDVGCGCGAGTELLAQVARTTYGVDNYGAAISYCRGRSEIQTPGWYYQVQDAAEELQFGDNAFQVVVCFEVLEHLARPERALAEIAKVLIPGDLGGLLLASTPNRTFHDRPQIPTERDGFHVREYTGEEFWQLLARNGFDVSARLGQRPEGTWAVEPAENGAMEFTILVARKRQ